jgi:hypothetical protein
VSEFADQRAHDVAWMTAQEREDLDDDFLPSVQALINTGMAWKLEGFIGRQCMAAIEAGEAVLGEVGHRDYYGNYVPSRYEVEPGSKGSVEYAEARGWEAE